MSEEPPLSRLQNDILKIIEKAKKDRRKEMTNFVTSLIRTYVPILVGAIAAWLITVGVELDAETQAGLVVALTGVSQAVYYLIVRLLEKKFPQFGILLGSANKPDYKG